MKSLRVFFYIVSLALLVPFMGVRAQLDPLATLIQENGVVPDEPYQMKAGDEYTGNAPLEFMFSANIESPSPSLRFEWNFSENADFSTIFLTRFDEETVYTFDRSGRFYVRLQVTDIDADVTDVSDAFVIQIAESSLKIPNAFSPNGDGINDVFQVSYKSLVKFEATIFNRWGQKLYHWGMNNIDEGWDGTAHGRQVPEGVYFIVVKAEGADGVKYNHKGDINILR